MPAPVNVKLQTPSSIPDWNKEATEWMNLNAEAHGNPSFYRLTVKAAYVIGVEHDLCESVSHLLKHPGAKTTTYIPAYGVFAAGVELLGRCINGNATTERNVADLKTGLKWLVSSSYNTIPDTQVVVTTTSRSHTVESLAALRHFAAHGQATSRKTAAGTRQFGKIDYEVLSMMPPLLADGLQRYWQELLDHESRCQKLAEANIIALRSSPVLRSWILFEKDASGRYPKVLEIFSRFDWRI